MSEFHNFVYIFSDSVPLGSLRLRCHRGKARALLLGVSAGVVQQADSTYVLSAGPHAAAVQESFRLLLASSDLRGWPAHSRGGGQAGEGPPVCHSGRGLAGGGLFVAVRDGRGHADQSSSFASLCSGCGVGLHCTFITAHTLAACVVHCQAAWPEQGAMSSDLQLHIKDPRCLLFKFNSNSNYF